MQAVDINTTARALGGEVAGRNRIVCPGPGHSKRDRSLAVTFTGNGFLVHSFAGDDFRECRDHVKAALGFADGHERPTAQNDNRPSIDWERLRKQKSAIEHWSQSAAISDTLAESYLASRGLSYGGSALRFHAGWRAMVALITNALTGEPQGIHRTYLDAAGKRIEKKMLGVAAGGVVRLSDDDQVTTGLAIGEGVETCLASDFRPVWACLSAGQVRAFPILSGVEALTVLVDHDRAGIESANACGERWHAAGRDVSLMMPNQRGADIADLHEAA